MRGCDDPASEGIRGLCPIMTKIYVGNPPFSAIEEQVRRVFAQHAKVGSVTLIADRETGPKRW